MTRPACPSILRWIGLMILALGFGAAVVGALFGLAACLDGHARPSDPGDALAVIGGWSLLLGFRGMVAGALLGLIVGAVRRMTHT